ncbi:MAG: hypothetical protein A2178_02015 [Planctomycetes bacterium GWC2_49_10]|nr:MAG: hypothetical protein A2178_02015 [Planctomycetes bacterium GWC2_49_10]
MNLYETFNQDRPLFLQTTGLYIFAAALPFSVSLIQGGILLFIAAGFWRRYNKTRFSGLMGEIKNNPLFPAFSAYLAAGILSATFGVSPARSFAALNSDLLTVVSFLGLCLFLEEKQRTNVLNVYIVSVSIAAIYGISQALGGLLQNLDVRAHASSHPVRFGEIMVIGLALALSRIAATETISPIFKKVFYTAALLITSAVILSQTRGAYLGMAMVFAVMLVVKRPPKRVILPLMAAAVLLGGGLSMLNPTIRNKITSIYQGANSAINTSEQAPDRSIGIRLILWKIGLEMIKDRPVFGAGPANVKTLFPLYCEKPYPDDTVWGSLHNLYIHQAAERGLIGLTALLALFTAMLTTAFRGFKTAPSGLTIWALAIMAPWFLMNITEITFQHVHTSYAVLLSLAVSITHSRATA